MAERVGSAAFVDGDEAVGGHQIQAVGRALGEKLFIAGCGVADVGDSKVVFAFCFAAPASGMHVDVVLNH